MRVRGWGCRPPLKPPLATCASAHPVPLHTVATSIPFSPSLPLPPPLYQAAERAKVLQELLVARTCPRPQPPTASAHQELTALLDELPPIAGSALQPHLRLRPIDQVKEELVQWRTACSRVHALLAGPLREDRWIFRNKVVRVVAHTMRLLMRCKMHAQAKELDRAFFTLQQPQTERRRSRAGPVAEAGEGGGLNESSYRTPGAGLGIKRGNINIAWMQSLALRLEPGIFRGSEAFGAELHELRREQRASGGINSHIVAFLIRQGPQLQRKLVEDGIEWKEAGQKVERMLESIRNHGRMGHLDVVRLALVESAMDEMERAIKKGEKLNRRAYRQIEEDVRGLVGEMEELEGEEAEALHDVLASSSPAGRTPAERELLALRAQVLHVAVRFLLFQAHHAPHSSQQHRVSLFRRSIASACKVYANLIDLLSLVASSPAELARLRQRQASSLIRIAWASVGTIDFTASEVTHDRGPREYEEDPPPPDLPAIERLHDVLKLTHTSVRSSPDVQLPYGISTRFWRRLLYTLTLPSAPSRRAGPAPPAVRPPWPLLRSILDIILTYRQHDSTVLHSLPDTSTAAIPVHSTPLFLRTSFLVHLVRAVLLGGTPPSTSTPEALEEEGSPLTRLSYLLRWISLMELTTVTRSINGGGLGKEVLRRGVVRSAVDEVVAREWGSGHVWAERRRKLRGLVKEWAPDGSNQQPVPSSTAMTLDDTSSLPVFISPPLKRRPAKWH